MFDGTGSGHTRLRDFLDRGGTDDAANFRFVLDGVLGRAGVVELGDLTPQTFYQTRAAARGGRLRSTGVAAVLHCLREDYAGRGIAWTPQDFGVLRAETGRRVRDDGFRWLLRRAPDLQEWARLARARIEATPANWKTRVEAPPTVPAALAPPPAASRLTPRFRAALAKGIDVTRLA